MTARESYGRKLSFQEFWPLISDEPPSLSLKAGTESKTEKKNYVGKESSGSVRR